ncbi:unnamed protein product [Rhizophagus irregularis]|nr:unnamed protein product [Rhizophagus irregularis]
MNETAAPKKKTLKVVEDGAEQVEAATNVAVPFANFLPFIEEVSRLLKEIVDIYQTAVINKGICGVMLDRVAIAESATKKFLKVRENEEFFSAENYVNLQKLVTVVGKIRKFLAEISQVRGLKKHTQAKNIEKTAMDLNKEFDSTIQLLEFAFMVDFSLRDDIDNKKIRADIEDLIENLQAIGGGGGRFDPNKNVSTIMDKSETNIFQSELLPYNDFEEVEVGENVVADESIKEEAKNNIKNQVTILSKLEECDNIIQFFGLTTIDGNKWFLVTEWAEYGNLREFYNTFGPLDVKAKVLFAIDISRGLSFLNAVEIVHCDIRAENILITDYQTAKIANFSSSKAVTDVTKNHKTTLERVRYCAPENSEKLGTQTKYNTKSEIYSFGILLWEIAEEKVPYANYNDIMAITELVGEKKYREPFSDASPLPKEYQDIAKKAVDHDPNYRPSFTKIFTVLQDLYMKTSSNSIGSSSPIGSEWIKKKMEEEDINYFEYNEFSKPIPIGKGGFGFVHKAETNDKKQVALKGLIDSVIDENVIKNFVKELKLLRMVSYHDNINRFLGITKDNIGYVMRFALKKYISE